MATEKKYTKAQLTEFKKNADEHPQDQSAKNKYFWPLYHFSKELLANNDIGNTINCIHELVKYSDNGPLAVKQIGWLIFGVLKILVKEQEIKEKYKSKINGLTKIYADIDIPAIEEVHSFMLWAVLELDDTNNNSWFLPLMKESQILSFRLKDYEGGITEDGRKYNSTAEKAIIHTAKHIEASPSDDTIKWFFPKLNEIIEKKNDNIWLGYHKGKILLAQNKPEEARIFVNKVLLQKKNDFWAWHLLGSTYKDQLMKALSYYCKGLLCTAPEEFFISLREDTAKLFVEMGRYNEAKTEIETIIKVRTAHKYKIPSALLEYSKNEWYTKADIYKNNEAIYKEFSKAAEEDTLKDLPKYVGIISRIDDVRGAVFISFSIEKQARLKTTDFRKYRMGNIVEITVQELQVDGQMKYNALKCIHSNSKPDISFYNEMNGSIKLKMKDGEVSFGFIEDVYVHNSLLKSEQFTDGEMVTVKAIKEFNKKKGEYSWKAIEIKKTK